MGVGGGDRFCSSGGCVVSVSVVLVSVAVFLVSVSVFLVSGSGVRFWCLLVLHYLCNAVVMK